MTWTTERPTKPGWYWVRLYQHNPWIAEVKEWRNSGLFVNGCPLAHYGSGDEQVMGRKYEWYGPLEAPK